MTRSPLAASHPARGYPERKRTPRALDGNESDDDNDVQTYTRPDGCPPPRLSPPIALSAINNGNDNIRVVILPVSHPHPHLLPIPPNTHPIPISHPHPRPVPAPPAPAALQQS
ncbi:hypothetical protein PILCRDRAFT_14304 [Piloderma croceum F 1598]|uniref:Uncharacterized protein n=1 Tax=Piloderma croceum (strain F 1598) TaxID=765440 RepID=A0A0C3BBF4_PILCF|nr:hypothetical protein PILCRDRAFT_14304 [Piloderma croceum F 1598]